METGEIGEFHYNEPTESNYDEGSSSGTGLSEYDEHVFRMHLIARVNMRIDFYTDVLEKEDYVQKVLDICQENYNITSYRWLLKCLLKKNPIVELCDLHKLYPETSKYKLTWKLENSYLESQTELGAKRYIDFKPNCQNITLNLECKGKDNPKNVVYAMIDGLVAYGTTDPRECIMRHDFKNIQAYPIENIEDVEGLWKRTKK